MSNLNEIFNFLNTFSLNKLLHNCSRHLNLKNSYGSKSEDQNPLKKNRIKMRFYEVVFNHNDRNHIINKNVKLH